MRNRCLFNIISENEKSNEGFRKFFTLYKLIMQEEN